MLLLYMSNGNEIYVPWIFVDLNFHFHFLEHFAGMNERLLKGTSAHKGHLVP